jgi:hypothetical protein
MKVVRNFCHREIKDNVIKIEEKPNYCTVESLEQHIQMFVFSKIVLKLFFLSFEFTGICLTW